MKQLLLVFVGGGFGSILRFLIQKFVHNTETGFPLATFSANVLGSLLIGIILGIASKNNALTENQILFLATGFCGGFTTFSTFAFENQNLLKTGDYTTFFLYSSSTFIIALLAVLVGLFLSR